METVYSLLISFLKPLTDNDEISDGHTSYPHIRTLVANLQYNLQTITSSKTVGYVKAHLLDKKAIDAIGPAEMWSQCKAFDDACAPDTKLNKVENFLANGSFPANLQSKIDGAEWILYIEEAFVELGWRRMELSLLAIELLIQRLDLGEKCIAMLQAGSITRLASDESSGKHTTAEILAKLTKHWKRIGFSEWSDSDDAWLCLWTSERTRIQDVEPGLFQSDKD